MGYFYWLCVKNPNHLHTEITLDCLKDTKFYLESKASFIHISSIASFKPFLIAWLWEYYTFPRLGQNTPSMKLFSKKKKIMFYYQTFFFFKYVLYLTALSKYLKKISRGSP